MKTFIWLLGLCLWSSAGWASININTASETELATLNGIGAAKARAIVAHRLQHGSFSNIEDIQRMSGIGPVLYLRIKDDISASPNTAPTPAKARSTLPRPALKRITPSN